MLTLPPLRPVPGRRPDDVLRIAHRGGAAGPAVYDAANLRRVAALGTHLLEFDVRATSDDQLVVHHDATIMVDRVGSWAIADHSLAELLESSGGALRAAADVIQWARAAGLGLYVDLKALSPAGAEGLITMLRGEGMADRTILASAQPTIVALCARLASEVPRAIMFNSVSDDPVQLARAVLADFVHPCWEARPDPARLLAGPWLRQVRAHRLGVICWHEERSHVLQGLYALGVDGICTDEPELLTRAATLAARSI